MHAINRRRFIRCSSAGAIAAVGVGHAVSPWWTDAALAATGRRADTERTLVVVQLSGGNDGLNTIIPFADEAYQENRLTLSYNKDNVLRINNDLGWHPSARGLADLQEAGRLSVIQGVGYPNPNRSHFESMDLWHTAHANSRATGWLGRFADVDPESKLNTPHSVYVGSGVRPLALQARDSIAWTVRDLDQFRLRADARERDIVQQLATTTEQDNDYSQLIASNLRAALRADEQLASTLRQSSGASYRGDALGNDLRQVAAMIRSGLPARVYYVTLDGFDTHANQRAAHASLLDQLSSGVKAFCDDLANDGLLDQVLLMCFSEFGRRVKENGSQGTDHGVAGPMFIAGGNCRGGIVGDHPSLTDLVEGDLKHAIDYRSVYRTLLEDWLGTSNQALIEGQYDKLPNLLA
jgi:uncharacterized protein (DUF1501 family)